MQAPANRKTKAMEAKESTKTDKIRYRKLLLRASHFLVRSEPKHVQAGDPSWGINTCRAAAAEETPKPRVEQIGRKQA